MYILAYKHKEITPPFTARRISIDCDNMVIGHDSYTEVNPREFFNNTEYPFMFIDGDRSDYITGFSSMEDHGLYILSDKTLTGTNRIFQTYLPGSYPVNILYSTEISKWIITDGASQNVGIMEATTLEGPWNVGDGYGGDPDYAPTPTPIPLSNIKAIFRGETYPQALAIFFDNTDNNLYNFYFIGIGSTGETNYRVDADYGWNTSEVDINNLTKETPLNFTAGCVAAGGVMGENEPVTIMLLN